jgi:hypothetical protein
LAYLKEIRNAVARLERRKTFHELVARAARQQRRLTLVQTAPQRVLFRWVGLPILLHYIVSVGTGVIASECAVFRLGGECCKKFRALLWRQAL